MLVYDYLKSNFIIYLSSAINDGDTLENILLHAINVTWWNMTDISTTTATKLEVVII